MGTAKNAVKKIETYADHCWCLTRELPSVVMSHVVLTKLLSSPFPPLHAIPPLITNTLSQRFVAAAVFHSVLVNVPEVELLRVAGRSAG